MSTKQQKQDSDIAQHMHARLKPRTGGHGAGMQAARPIHATRMAGTPAIQAKCEACAHDEEEALQQKEQRLSIQKQEGSAAPPASGAEEEMLGGMPKAQFFELLESSICNAVDSQLVGTPYTALGCPWIRFWIDKYKDKSVAEIELAISKFGDYYPGDNEGMIYVITAQVKKSVDIWRKTGLVTGTPDFYEEIDCEMALQNKGNMPAGGHDPAAVRDQLGAGQSLSGQDQSRFSTAFGSSFSDVRIHTDSTAVQLSKQLGARAFTVGNHVAFNTGEYRPGSITGDALMAHELAHVQQQRGGETKGLQSKGGSSYGALEADADTTAVGVIGKLWGQTKEYAEGIGQRSGAALRTGLRLQGCPLAGCGGEHEPPEEVPEDKPKEEQRVPDGPKDVEEKKEEPKKEEEKKEDEITITNPTVTADSTPDPEALKKKAEAIKKVNPTATCKNKDQLKLGLDELAAKISADEYPAFTAVEFKEISKANSSTASWLAAINKDKKTSINYYDDGYYSKYQEIVNHINEDIVKKGKYWQPGQCIILPKKYPESFFQRKEGERISKDIESKLKGKEFQITNDKSGNKTTMKWKPTSYELYWIPKDTAVANSQDIVALKFKAVKDLDPYYKGRSSDYALFAKEVNDALSITIKPDQRGFYFVLPVGWEDPFMWEQPAYATWAKDNAKSLSHLVATIYAEQTQDVPEQHKYIWQSYRLRMLGPEEDARDPQKVLKGGYDAYKHYRDLQKTYDGAADDKAKTDALAELEKNSVYKAIQYQKGLSKEQAAKAEFKSPKFNAAVVDSIKKMVKDEWKSNPNDASEKYFHVTPNDVKISNLFKTCFKKQAVSKDEAKWNKQVKACAEEAANGTWTDKKYKMEKMIPGKDSKVGDVPLGYMFVMKPK